MDQRTIPDFQHEEDCPCFGDVVEHSIDCKNCTCDKSCKIPPEGWVCSREYGHEGPCAAQPKKLWQPESSSATSARIRELEQKCALAESQAAEIGKNIPATSSRASSPEKEPK